MKMNGQAIYPSTANQVFCTFEMDALVALRMCDTTTQYAGC